MKTIRSSHLLAKKTKQTGTEWSLPKSLKWAPAGRHEIHATVGDSPWQGYVDAREEDAARLDAQLQALLTRAESGQISRPYIDFDHRPGPAAAIPLRFFWDEGIRLEVEWTSDGEAALRGRSYSYFSPEVIIDDGG